MDCCAASGGKSILIFDILNKNIQLTVSDIRENILLNLNRRMREAGVPVYQSFIADLSLHSGLSADKKFSIIVCDVPCTGSGTWARTPEELCNFQRNSIDSFASRQKKIVGNVIPHLDEDGLFFYITCSVFKKENEEVVNFIKDFFELRLLHLEYLAGYQQEANTMFVAVFMR